MDPRELEDAGAALRNAGYFQMWHNSSDQDDLLAIARCLGQLVTPLDCRLRNETSLIDAGRLEEDDTATLLPTSTFFHHEDLCSPIVPNIVLLHAVGGQNATITLRDVTLKDADHLESLIGLNVTSRCSNYRPGLGLNDGVSQHPAAMRSPLSQKYALMIDTVFSDKIKEIESLCVQMLAESAQTGDIEIELESGSTLLFDNYRFAHKSKFYAGSEYLEYWKIHISMDSDI